MLSQGAHLIAAGAGQIRNKQGLKTPRACWSCSFVHLPPCPGEGQIRVKLADGRQKDFDILVGADGIWSRIRKLLVGETEVRGCKGGPPSTPRG